MWSNNITAENLFNNKISVIILTLNEEKNIQYAVKSVIVWAKEIVILDSYSTDNTCAIAKKMGCRIFQRKFDNYASQRNYAIKELPIESDWVFFLDADESMPESLMIEINNVIKLGDVVGFYVRYHLYFMNKKLRFGGHANVWLLRLFKKKDAVCLRENNEHIFIEGPKKYLKNRIIHNDRKDIFNWINKHNFRSSVETNELLAARKGGSFDILANILGSQTERKRWIRLHIWNKLLPPIIRPFLYFIYRYFFKLGFLDGKVGFIYHFLLSLWFPLLIDIKYLEAICLAKKEN